MVSDKWSVVRGNGSNAGSGSNDSNDSRSRNSSDDREGRRKCDLMGDVI